VAFINDSFAYSAMSLVRNGFVQDSLKRCKFAYESTPLDEQMTSLLSPTLPTIPPTLSCLYNTNGLIQELGFTPTSIPTQIHNVITALVHFDHVWPYISYLNHLILDHRQTIASENRSPATVEAMVLSSLQHAIQQHIHSIYFYFHSQLIQLVKRTPPVIIYRDNYFATRPGGTGNQSNTLELTHEILLRKRLRHPSAKDTDELLEPLEDLRLSYNENLNTKPPIVVFQPPQLLNNNKSVNNNNINGWDKQVEIQNNNQRFQAMMELFSLPSPPLTLPTFYPA
jgi:hypothetical protein